MSDEERTPDRDRPGDVRRDAIDQIATRLSQTFPDRTFIGVPR